MTVTFMFGLALFFLAFNVVIIFYAINKVSDLWLSRFWMHPNGESVDYLTQQLVWDFKDISSKIYYHDIRKKFEHCASIFALLGFAFLYPVFWLYGTNLELINDEAYEDVRTIEMTKPYGEDMLIYVIPDKENGVSYMIPIKGSTYGSVADKVIKHEVSIERDPTLGTNEGRFEQIFECNDREFVYHLLGFAFRESESEPYCTYQSQRIVVSLDVKRKILTYPTEKVSTATRSSSQSASLSGTEAAPGTPL